LLCSVRFLVVLLLFLGATVQYTHKTDISIGIICMINNSAINQTNQFNNNELYKLNDVQCKIHNESKQKDPVNKSLNIRERIIQVKNKSLNF